MLDGLDWMDWISKNTTTTRAPSGANKFVKLPIIQYYVDENEAKLGMSKMKNYNSWQDMS